MSTPETQYSTDTNLAARQGLWDTSNRRPPFSLQSWVLGLCRLKGTESVLDVGCGNGSYLEIFRGIGVDSSMGMLVAARQRSDSPLGLASATDLPFTDQAFDVVLCAHMLYHVGDRRRAASELRRVLHRSGVCVVVTNGERTQPELKSIVEEVVGNNWTWKRSSEREFSLENGAAQLQHAFESVERVDCPRTVIEVTDADVVARYLTSVSDYYRPETAGWIRWEDVVDRCRSRVAQTVRNDGAFRISTSIGAFVCQ